MESLTYVWPGINRELRFKTRVVNRALSNPQEEFKPSLVPWWSFDASSTGSITVNHQDRATTEQFLKPVRVFADPFLKQSASVTGKIVLCEVMQYDEESLTHQPAQSNTRHLAQICFAMNTHLKPWFGIEQEYFIINNADPDQSQLFIKGSEANENWSPSSTDYYCAITSDKKIYFDLVEPHMMMCLEAGVAIGGINAEVVPFQYEFQVGHVASQTHQIEGIEAADHLFIARYILERLAISKGYSIVYDPKPFPNANGSGAHINYSDAVTRQGKGLLERAAHLDKHHAFNLKHFGTNTLRLTGRHETSDPSTFSVGIGSRNTTVRIPSHQNEYLEYRLPAADLDPYICTALMFVEMTCDDSAAVLTLQTLLE